MKQQIQPKFFFIWAPVFVFLFSILAKSDASETLSKQGKVHYISLHALSKFYSLKHVPLSSGKEILYLKEKPLTFSSGSNLVTLDSKTLFSLNRAVLPKDHRLSLSVASTLPLLPLFKNSLIQNPIIRIPNPIKTILIDPGHGGKDMGAFKNGLVEKKLNLKIAKLVFKNLSQFGFRVKMTRYKDSALQKNERVLMADQIEADLLISIHANYSKHAKAKGLEFFILKDLSSHSEIKTMKTALPDSPLFYECLNKNYQRITRNLCLSMEKHLTRLDGVKTRGIKNAGFYLLKNSHCPTVFVEMGFISNPDEAAQFKNTDHLEALANALTQGIVEYCHNHHIQEV